MVMVIFVSGSLKLIFDRESNTMKESFVAMVMDTFCLSALAMSPLNFQWFKSQAYSGRKVLPC